jgi:hypothetical protein
VYNITLFIYVKVKVKVKSKAMPLEACRGPEGFRRLRIPEFKKIGT